MLHRISLTPKVFRRSTRVLIRCDGHDRRAKRRLRRSDQGAYRIDRPYSQRLNVAYGKRVPRSGADRTPPPPRRRWKASHMHIPHWARRLDVVMLQGIDPVVNGVKIDRQHRADNREARRRPAFERCCFARLPELCCRSPSFPHDIGVKTDGATLVHLAIETLNLCLEDIVFSVVWPRFSHGFAANSRQSNALRGRCNRAVKLELLRAFRR